MAVYTKIGLDEINLIEKNFSIGKILNYSGIKKGIENGVTGDLLSIDLRKAIDSIGEITGQITNDEMLGNIFSNFCIGK